MLSHDRVASDEQKPSKNLTPSTTSRVKSAPPENAFPTPPRREHSRPDSRQSGRQSPGPARLFSLSKASPAPKESRSIDALRSKYNVSRAHSSGLAGSGELEKVQQREMSKKTSQFFDQTFAVRDSYYSAKERVARESMIVVEIKFNCCLEKEHSFVNDLLAQLCELYHRPVENVMIVVATDAHILIGGSTEPAYLMTVTALPSEIAALKNLRTAHVVQEHLSEVLKIPANRGVVKFQAVKEDEIATDKTTAGEQINRMEAEEKRGLSMRSRQSHRAKRGSTLPTTSESFADMDQSRSHTPLVSESRDLPLEEDEDKVKPQRSTSSAGKLMRGKKSIMQFWKKV